MTLSEAIEKKLKNPGLIIGLRVHETNFYLQLHNFDMAEGQTISVNTSPDGTGTQFDHIRLDGWEIVNQESVSWQEAIQAWNDGKSLRVELPDQSITILKSHVGIFCSQALFNSGKWYILDDQE